MAENVLFISAQPDTPYFVWQIELQLFNFRSFGIIRNNIHVLFAFDAVAGPSRDVLKLSELYAGWARFYFYEDSRSTPKYISSIRPHIIAKHFYHNPDLSKRILFYHDSDVLFSRLPTFKPEEINSPVCYVSDTSSYFGTSHIKKAGGDVLLGKMCEIVGLDKQMLEQEDENTGGAQYIIKAVDVNFWRKVEADSEALYCLLRDANLDLWKGRYPSKRERKGEVNDIQPWCADMWAILWNLWIIGKKVEIHQELKFTWPYSPIEDWYKSPIQPYAGVTSEEQLSFKKNNYLHFPPWYDGMLKQIPSTNCSYEIVKQIEKVRLALDKRRTYLSTVHIIILFDPALGNIGAHDIEIQISYIQRYLDVRISKYPQREGDKIDDFLERFCLDVSLNKDGTFILIPESVVFDHNIFIDLCKKAAALKQSFVFEIEETHVADMLFKVAFEKTLDFQFLQQNVNKFTVVPKKIQIFTLLGSEIRRKRSEDLVHLMNRVFTYSKINGFSIGQSQNI
ncbi:hypothetical protein [Sphingobacterium deserti]|uniref:Orf45 n=1 Tax=Sphingobacterium deserti TaxID=1229276 RepID=A0A0B8TCL5_9SPHI|nr:hypothetical protein [Sphingobacterium deserti]KGE16125.1 Orf45 [Sphingobacterium deserti]